MKTEFSFKFTGKDFKCHKTPAPPTPDGPKAPHNDDANVGMPCAKTDDCTAKVTSDDDKKKYCCGTATDGKLVGADGKDIDGSVAANSVVCGMVDPIALQAGYKTPSGT